MRKNRFLRAILRFLHSRVATVFSMALLFIVLPLILTDPFPRHVLIMLLLYALLGVAWNILGGYAGQISLGHAVYFGIGAYTSTLLAIRFSISPWIGMVAGGILAVTLSVMFGYPFFRLRGHYFAIATLVFGEVIMIIFLNWDFVGKALGLSLPLVGSSLRHFQFEGKLPYYYIILALCAITAFTAHGIERSKLGLYLRAIKGSHPAAESIGVDTTMYKLIALGISAFFTAIAGTFYAQYVLYIDPYSVTPVLLSVKICLAAILGGVSTFWGPALGAAVLVPLSEYSRVWLGGGGRGIDLIIYGGLIIIMAVFQPLGLIGLLQSFRRKVFHPIDK